LRQDFPTRFPTELLNTGWEKARLDELPTVRKARISERNNTGRYRTGWPATHYKTAAALYAGGGVKLGNPVRIKSSGGRTKQPDNVFWQGGIALTGTV
jgi:hypothetical protein